MNPLLEAIALNAADDLRAQLNEAGDDLLQAIHDMQEECDANDKKPKFNIGFKIAIDFDARAYHCSLSWSTKQTLTVSHEIEDLAQAKLPINLDDNSIPFTKRADAFLEKTVAELNAKDGGDRTLLKNVTIGEAVTITADQAQKAMKSINKKLRKKG